MGGVNTRFGLLSEEYLFREIETRRVAYETAHPAEHIISLGIGDVTLPLGRCVTGAMALAAKEMGTLRGFHGYPPAFGYPFLREAVAGVYAERGVSLSPEEIYISDGAKTDAALLPQLFSEVPVLVTDPGYPVYRDMGLLGGHRVRFLPATRENGYLPTPHDLEDTPQVICLCSPGNPTGAAYDRVGMEEWVAYARKSGSLLVWDAAYAAYLSDDAPHSIFEVPDARLCAVELGSFSKSAGFTGVRCAWSVFTEEVSFDGQPLASLWRRLKSTSSNGVSYLTQRGAEAALSEKGREECEKKIAYYRENAARLSDCLFHLGWQGIGGGTSPYLWLECPAGLSSWDTFDLLLTRAGLVTTPGVGFGRTGEGHLRFSSFARREEIMEAVRRLRRVFGK